MFKSYVTSHMNMLADVYVQRAEQSDSGIIKRKWAYEKTLECRAEAVDNFRYAKHIGQNQDGFLDILFVRLKTTEPISRRWRITSIETNKGASAFPELDKISQPDTIFEVISSHTVTDPFGNISYYETILKRAVVQENDIYTS